MIRIAICDDCETSAKDVGRVILNYQKVEITDLSIFTHPSDLIDSINKEKTYDIVFLDIEMSELNGIELGKQIKSLSPNTYIVFVTSYPEYAIAAYECEAYNYLLKPLSEEKTYSTIDRLMRKVREKHKYHLIKIKGDIVYIPIKDIYFIECCQKHVIYYLENKDYDTVGYISDAYDKLKEYGFLQVHQGYIVNMDKISYINKLSVVLTDSRTVPVSVRKRADVLTKYAKYMEEHY